MKLLVRVEREGIDDEFSSIAVYLKNGDGKYDLELWRVTIVDDPEHEAKMIADHYADFAKRLGQPLESVTIEMEPDPYAYDDPMEEELDRMVERR